jgi:hypothetical protein
MSLSSSRFAAYADLAAIKGLVEVLAGEASALGRAGAMAEIGSDACKIWTGFAFSSHQALQLIRRAMIARTGHGFLERAWPLTLRMCFDCCFR